MEFIVSDALKASASSVAEEYNIGNANIKVIGCGGGGINSVDWLYNLEFFMSSYLSNITASIFNPTITICKKILIGKETTRGLGAGGMPNKGLEAAKESIHEIKETLKGADMVFVCAGMGGGTGTGSAPLVSQIAKENGSIVIGVVTMPFNIEKARIDKAEFGLKQMRQFTDTVIVIDNNKLSTIAGNLPIQQAFAVANELIATMIKGIVEIIAVPSLINLDYADVRTIMSSGGLSVIGIGESDSEGKVEEAVHRALSNPLLEVKYDGAHGALIHITGGPDLTLEQAEKVGELITGGLDDDAMVIWGARIDPKFQGKLRVMTIVTGVQSPFVLGKHDSAKPSHESVAFNRELGIDLL